MKITTCIFLLLSLTVQVNAQKAKANSVFNIVFTSDAHFGITRDTFRGQLNVDAVPVNIAMVNKINTIPLTTLPDDGGINANKRTGGIDYIFEGGDVSNRMEVPCQSAGASWKQFDEIYIKGLTVKNQYGKPAKLLIVPGNHDVSNAIGFHKLMEPAKDPTAMVKIYNLMIKPATPKTNDTYEYSKDKIIYSKNIGGVHFIFLNIWADSLERIWMEQDLKKVSRTTPVILVTHDQPECDPRHFTSPLPIREGNPDNLFEDLLPEKYKDATNNKDGGNSTDIEQRGFVQFLKQHPNIVAYFHGHANYNDFYVYHGPDNDISLNTFRVDSPMKGKYSLRDQTKLSFQLITIDTKSITMTVRECLWNADPAHPEKPVQWGTGKTVSLKVNQ